MSALGLGRLQDKQLISTLGAEVSEKFKLSGPEYNGWSSQGHAGCWEHATPQLLKAKRKASEEGFRFRGRCRRNASVEQRSWPSKDETDGLLQHIADVRGIRLEVGQGQSLVCRLRWILRP